MSAVNRYGARALMAKTVIEPVNRLATRTRKVDAGVVDDGLEWSGLVGLSSKGASRFDAGQIAHERRSGAGDGAHGVLGPILIAPVQDDLVADRHQVPGG